MRKRHMKRYFKSHKSLFLSVAASTGVILTGIFAGIGTIRANQIMTKENIKAKLEDVELAKKDIFLLTWKCYIPAVVTGASSIACIFGLNVLNKRQQEQLISAYALLNNTYHEYRKQVIERYGEEVDSEIQEAVAYDIGARYSSLCPTDIDYPDEKVIFFDPISGNSRLAYEREMLLAEYHLNRNFWLHGGYISLNEFYEFAGLPLTEDGDNLGWNVYDGYGWIDFEHRPMSKDDGGIPIYSIDIITPLSDEFEDY